MFITANQKEFLHMLKESTESGQRFCFIIGSGCSKSSGIPTGYELANKWYKELFDIFDQETIENWTKENKIDKNDLGKFYSDIFDFRFKLNASNGYHELERIMENAEPSSGYYFFARHLAETKNNLVITTNFDSLTEDALFIYTDKKPIVIGHESLANFVDLNATRPIIVKVHRGLYFNPKNTATDTTYMAEEWKSVLRKVFSIYTPVVIGYGGNDGSLMSFLNDVSVDLNSIYWCIRDKNSALCNEATELLEKRKGYCIIIEGFDEIMFMLGNTFGYSDPKETINAVATRRCETYDAQITKIKNIYDKIEYPTEQQKEFKKAVSEYSIKNLQSAIEYHKKYGSSPFSLNQLINAYIDTCNWENALKYANELIKCSDNSSSYVTLGRVYNKVQKYSKAIDTYNHALKLDRNNANAYIGMSDVLINLKKHTEAINALSKAIEVKKSYKNEDTSTLYKMRGILHEMNLEYDNALLDYEKAIQLKPNESKEYLDLGVFHESRKKFNKAIQVYSRLIDNEIDMIMGYLYRGTCYYKMGQFENALKDYYLLKSYKDIGINYKIALCYKDMGQKDKAIEACKELLQSDKSNISDKTIARTEQLLKELVQ